MDSLTIQLGDMFLNFFCTSMAVHRHPQYDYLHIFHQQKDIKIRNYTNTKLTKTHFSFFQKQRRMISGK